MEDKTKEIISESEFQSRCKDFTNKHIYYCLTSLIDRLFELYEFSYDDIENFYIYTFTDLDGYERIMSYEELEEYKEELNIELEELYNLYINSDNYNSDDSIESKEYINWNKLDNYINELENLESEAQEIYEWHLCSEFLINKLSARNECILDNSYITAWGRGGSGQSYYMDNVIRDIVSDYYSIESNNKYN